MATTNAEHLNEQHLAFILPQTIFPNCKIWRNTIIAVVQKDDPAARMSADTESTKTELIKREIFIHSLSIRRLSSVKFVILEIRADNLLIVVRSPGMKCLNRFGAAFRVLIELFNDSL